MSNKLASKLRRAELRRSFRTHAPFCASAAEKGVGFFNMLHLVMRPEQEREMDHAAAWKLMQEARKRAAKTRKAHPGAGKSNLRPARNVEAQGERAIPR